MFGAERQVMKLSARIKLSASYDLSAWAGAAQSIYEEKRFRHYGVFRLHNRFRLDDRMRHEEHLSARKAVAAR